MEEGGPALGVIASLQNDIQDRAVADQAHERIIVQEGDRVCVKVKNHGEAVFSRQRYPIPVRFERHCSRVTR